MNELYIKHEIVEFEGGGYWKLMLYMGLGWRETDNASKCGIYCRGQGGSYGKYSVEMKWRY